MTVSDHLDRINSMSNYFKSRSENATFVKWLSELKDAIENEGIIKNSMILTKERLMQFVCEETGISLKEIRSTMRKDAIVFARHIFCHNCLTVLKLGESVISQFINRDRSTVYNSEMKYSELYEYHFEFRMYANKVSMRVQKELDRIKNETAKRLNESINPNNPINVKPDLATEEI